ncbi:DUF4365 domain-containing protein [Solwaraspora sp. WMMD1047]|uniref:DUF4365 domain-containing protein n=1 Tax=Solwaraspora sp. WMMD1047 TaxID=3016102 RepID=UPI002417D3EF|nr:DUF4365 domain-containing protein [Solwaraspora sp. WMMD1047]MDG4834192.1 DUF4365 domain-containing protein [Solwaraspora sp. WMMD1047]
MTNSSSEMERKGVAAAQVAFTDMGWAFREQPEADHGIDALVEVDGLRDPTGRYIALQIKSGSTFFKRKTRNGWRFTEKPRLLTYWLAHLMPVVLVIIDPATRLGYWVQITADAVNETNRGWSIEVPSANVLDDSSREPLRAIAFAVPAANPDPIEEVLPLLPPAAVEMLSGLSLVDPSGARRLARLLSAGRHDPRAVVKPLLEASQSWVRATAGRLETIGAYANDHGHRDLAVEAFTLAADRDPGNQLRLRAITAVMALAAGDRDRAADLLHPSQDPQPSDNGLLWDVAVCALDADESGREDMLERLLRERPDSELDAEPTCLLFLAERASGRGDLDQALVLYQRVRERHPRSVGGRLGQARILMERILRGDSALPFRDRQEVTALAASVRDDIRRWAGPSEAVHRLLVQERMLVGAFMEVIELATPAAFGGQATDREASDPVVAIVGAQASIALDDGVRAGRFGDAVRGTPAELLIRALVADTNRPAASVIGMWRTALDTADTALAARICLNQLASRGALDATDLHRMAALANLNDGDRVVLTARNAAAGGDLDTAVTLLRSVRSPSAGEILIDILREAGRYDEAVAVCDDVWGTYGALKGLQEKVNILAIRGDLDAADRCARELLATGELAAEQRGALHRRLIKHSATRKDWTSVEACCRAALKDEPTNHDYAWALIISQLNQNRWEAAWASYRQLRPDITHPAIIPAWVDLHLRFNNTPQAQAAATALANRFANQPHTLSKLERLNATARPGGPTVGAGGVVDSPEAASR